MGMAINPNHPHARGVSARVVRSMDPRLAKTPREARHREGRRQRFAKAFQILPEDATANFMPNGFEGRPATLMRDHHSGLWVRGWPVVKFDTAALDAMVIKFVRGVYRKRQGAPLPASVSACPMFITWEQAHNFIDGAKLQPVGAPGFLCWGGVAQEDPISSSMWIFLVWGTIVLCGITGDAMKRILDNARNLR
jgi:hypothetical protein